MNGHAKGAPRDMTIYPYILFNKSPEQLRQLGARGGRTQGRNRRLHRLLQVSAPPAPPIEPDWETAAEAIAALDAQFPWLRGAEKRTSPVRHAPATAVSQAGCR
jgi:hypothetical protein